MKKSIAKYFRIAVSFVLLVYLFYYLIDFRSLLKVLSSADPFYLAVSVSFFMLSIFAAAYRWQYVVSAKSRHLSLRSSLREYFIGLFFNNFLPGSIGGDVVRIMGASGEIGSKEIAVSSVIVERLIGLMALVFIGLTGLLFLNIGSDRAYAGLSISLLTTLSLILLILVNKRLNGAFCDLIVTYMPEKISSNFVSYLKDFSGYSDSFVKLGVIFIISLVFKIFDGLFLFFIFKSLSIDLTYAHAIAMFAIINIIKMIPISLNGIGLSAVSWVMILKNFGIGDSVSASVDFLTITISLVVSSVGGLLYFRKNALKKQVPAG